MGALAVCTVVSAGLIGASSAGADPRPARARFSEENLPAEELPPTATPTEDSSQPSGPADASSPAAAAAPSAAVTPTPLVIPEAQTEPTPAPTPTDIAPLEVGSLQPKPQVSDSTLEPIIAHASSPALAASLRVTEEARQQILGDRADEAIHTLGRAVSIDPSNPYAYFYLGRAWLKKKNYDQALTFFRRAEIAFGSNSDWLGESLAFEGLTDEQSGKTDEALAAYQKAMHAEPGNLMARVGLVRLTPEQPVAPPESNPAPDDSDAAPPPEQNGAPPPPQSEPPQGAY